MKYKNLDDIEISYESMDHVSYYLALSYYDTSEYEDDVVFSDEDISEILGIPKEDFVRKLIFDFNGHAANVFEDVRFYDEESAMKAVEWIKSVLLVLSMIE